MTDVKACETGISEDAPVATTIKRLSSKIQPKRLSHNTNGFLI